MVGRGTIEPRDTEPHPRVFGLDAEGRWVRAVDPLMPGAGVSLGSSFARTLAAADPAATIGLVPCAKGSTQLDLWIPGTSLYANAVKRTRAALQHGRLAGVLWHQGEGDSARQLESTYAERFAAMIAQLRRDLNAPDAPVIVGELGTFWRTPEPMNQVLRDLPALVPRSACASSAGLSDKGDRIHFDAESLREFGRRYATAFLSITAKPPLIVP
ncbi:MAG: sialate O-acetylesterase [Opitutus sp.]|nr:sialate O-acetylesterase [Opitutus sp.]